MILKEGRADIWRRNNLTSYQVLAEVVGTILEPNKHRMWGVTKTVSCISIQLPTVNGT